MPTYDPTGHPRLSTEAASLSAEALDAYADEAEALFGIAGTSYTGQDRADLTLAVVRQVGLSLRLEGYGGGVLEREEKGDQGYTLARGKDGMPTRIDAIAQAIVDRVTAAAVDTASVAAWPIAGGLR